MANELRGKWSERGGRCDVRKGWHLFESDPACKRESLGYRMRIDMGDEDLTSFML